MGKLDILVSNAGISQRMLFEQTTLKDIHKILNVNFISNISIAYVCIDYLKKSKGQIAVTSSIQGIIGNPVRCIYSASKHALQGFYKSLAAEVYKYNLI